MESSTDFNDHAMKQKIVVFHPIIAPYRIDLFNALAKHYDADIVLWQRNLKSQTFDYAKIEAQFEFEPQYLVKEEMGTLQWFKAIWHKLFGKGIDYVLVSEFGVVTILAVLAKMVFRKHYRLVSIVDDSYNMVAEDNQFSLRHKWATRLLMPHIDNVVNVEPRVTDYYRSHYGKGVYFPIIADDVKAAERLQRVLPISERYVREYGLEGKKVLLFVGRLVALKNIAFAIDAYKQIADNHTAFVIVGDGEEMASLRAKAVGCKSIIFTCRLEGNELYAWYNVAQVFTLPSTQEPFGAVTNEALQGGCFALISRLAGSNCLVENEVNGFVIDPYDEAGFVEALKAAFSRCEQLTLPLAQRKSKMLESFNDYFLKLVSNL